MKKDTSKSKNYDLFDIDFSFWLNHENGDKTKITI